MPLSPHASSFTVCHATAVWRTTDKRCICRPCQFLVVHVNLVQVLSVRKFVAQLVRRLPKNFADAVPEA